MGKQSSPIRSRTYLVGSDKKRDIHVFSGITYHLALQGVQDDWLSGMINLYPRGIGAWRVYARAAWWNYGGGVRRRLGFQFTDGYLDGIWKRGLRILQGATVINNFQLFGLQFLQSHQAFGIVPYFYIDATLGEYFGDYRRFDTAGIGESVIRHALAVERAGYARSHKLAVMSKRSATYLVQHYDVPRDRIHVVPPGANIPEHLIEKFDDQHEPNFASKKTSLTIGFIGLSPERKGLPTISEAVRLLRSAGYDIYLNVIGACPPEISQQDGVNHFGLIDKSTDMDHFIEIMQGIDIGCMLSRAEAAGIAYLEFLRMGVPVIATDVGGAPEILKLGAGQLVSPGTSAPELAQLLAEMIDEPYRLEELREKAWRRRHNASWRRAVRELKVLLA